ncbi:NADH-quinone oxidoreductase subunit NuoH [Myxococcota bacterium]|nr:NADH-quinone oxidoreductase subunit NuoH [Myxococcota bacterium]
MIENPWLHGLVLGLVVVAVVMGVAAFSIWYERKFAGLLQNRPGPTEVGPWGLGQLIADAIKLLQKEQIVPAAADRPLFLLAPLLVLTAALVPLAVIPWGPGLVGADLHVGVLFALAASSLMLFPVWMAGWASNNKYALLGGMRSVAQGISYEIPLLLSATVPIVLAQSFRLGDIVAAQEGLRWFALWPPGPGTLAFGLFMATALAEANRIPFDIPEAESELVAGVTVEYTGMNFGMFYLAEYLHTFIASALGAALFLGGWDMGPLGAGLHWMVLKTLVLFAGIFWVRWSLLRLRSDQLMELCWRWLVPGSLLLVMAAALWVHLT